VVLCGTGLLTLMHIVLATTFLFAILTLWVPAYWPVAVFQVSVFSLAGVAVVRWRNHFPCVSWPMRVFTLAVGWGLIQWFTGTTVYRFETEKAIVHWATFLAVFIVGEFLFRDRFVSRWFRSVMLWFGLLVAILAVLQHFTSGGKVFWVFPSGYSDLIGPIAYHNHFAAFIEVVLPIALYQTFRSEHRTLLYGSMAAILYASIIVSGSRAGTVLATAEVLTITAIMRARAQTTGRTVGFAALTVLVLSTVLTLVVGWGVIWGRFSIPDPYSGRRELAISSLHMAADRPWLGFGLGTWPTAYSQYASFDLGLFINRAHCDWLEWTAEGGFPFGILIATLFGWTLRPAFCTVWGLGVVSVFLHAIVDYPFSRPALGSWSVLVIAMLAARTVPSTTLYDAKA
jgi:O-Antigen ligase